MKDHQKPIMLSLIDFVIGEVSESEVFNCFMCVSAKQWINNVNLSWEDTYDVYDTFIQHVDTLFPKGVDRHEGLQFALAVTHPDDENDFKTLTGIPTATPERTNAFRLKWLKELRKQYA